MTLKFSFNRLLVAPALALASMMFIAPAGAQNTAARPAVRIDGFDAQPVSRASAGQEIMFTLYGSPGGTARVQISGATGNVLLEESEPGLYEGVYTIRQRDHITAASSATVNLREGNQVDTAVLDDPLIGTPWNKRAAPNSPNVRIDRFGVDQPQSFAAGNELRFNLTGTPDAVASVRIGGVPGKVNLDEVRRGVYQGYYVIKNRDRLAQNTGITPYLRQGTYQTALTGQSMGGMAAQPVAQRPVVPEARPPVCNLCGVVEAVNPIQVKGEGSLVGKIGGGLVGALLGNQIGKGGGRNLATIAGAAGGAFAGNEVEKHVRTETHYEVRVRLDNGGSQTVSYKAEPGLAVGTRVRVESDGTLKTI